MDLHIGLRGEKEMIVAESDLAVSQKIAELT